MFTEDPEMPLMPCSMRHRLINDNFPGLSNRPGKCGGAVLRASCKWGKNVRLRNAYGVCSSAPAPKPPRKPRYSTYIVGAITALFMLLAAVGSGFTGALIVLAISLTLTGLYVLITGRRSWAWLPAQRKAGAVAMAASLALFV